MQLARATNNLGTESAFEVLAKATALAAAGKDVINLGIGQPDFPTPPHIIDAAIQAMREGHHGYTPADGILPLKEAVIEDMHKRRGVSVDPAQIVIVPGGKVTMATAIQMFGEPGADIHYPDPGFPIYRSMICFTGANPVPINLYEDKGYAFSADELLAQLTPKSRLIIVNSPANPTGGVVPKSELDKLVAGLAEFPDVAILSDEIYARMVYDGAPYASLTAYPEIADRLILLDGWSKTYAMTGWRIGWGVWPASIATMATRFAINTHSCVNAPTQWAAKAALEGPQDAVDEMMSAFASRRQLVMQWIERLPGMSCPMPGGAFYAFPNITQTGLGSRELQDRLLEEVGVAAISGTSFGINGEGYIRFSYAASAEKIEEAMTRVEGFLERAADPA